MSNKKSNPIFLILSDFFRFLDFSRLLDFPIPQLYTTPQEAKEEELVERYPPLLLGVWYSFFPIIAACLEVRAGCKVCGLIISQ